MKTPPVPAPVARAIDLLNILVMLDQPTIQKLVDNRQPCSTALEHADVPFVVTEGPEGDDRPHIGMIGVINGLLDTTTHRICATYGDDDKLVRFDVVAQVGAPPAPASAEAPAIGTMAAIRADLGHKRALERIALAELAAGLPGHFPPSFLPTTDGIKLSVFGIVRRSAFLQLAGDLILNARDDAGRDPAGMLRDLVAIARRQIDSRPGGTDAFEPTGMRAAMREGVDMCAQILKRHGIDVTV